jgi:hypothetical protein
MRVEVFDMASQFPTDALSYETRSQRSAEFWQKAQHFFHRACTAQTDEGKTLYMEIAKAWSALATELERPLPIPPQNSH